jgi:hypothetical protein
MASATLVAAALKPTLKNSCSDFASNYHKQSGNPTAAYHQWARQSLRPQILWLQSTIIYGL